MLVLFDDTMQDLTQYNMTSFWPKPVVKMLMWSLENKLNEKKLLPIMYLEKAKKVSGEVAELSNDSNLCEKQELLLFLGKCNIWLFSSIFYMLDCITSLANTATTRHLHLFLNKVSLVWNSIENNISFNSFKVPKLL